MQIYLGADHGGFKLKEAVKAWLKEQAYSVEDLGAEKYQKTDDYPDYAFKVAQAVSKAEKANQKVLGILFCTSGTGMAVAANKVKGVRAVVLTDERTAQFAKAHNDANVVTLAGDWVSPEKAIQLLKVFFDTEKDFSPRHQRRLNKVNNL